MTHATRWNWSRIRVFGMGVTLFLLAACSGECENDPGDPIPDPGQAISVPTDGIVVFERESEENSLMARGGSDIWSMFENGTDQRLVASGDGAGAQDPALSPDGTKVAFYMRDFRTESNASDTDIIVAAVDGRSKINLTGSFALHATEPSWAPDGSKIVFSAVAGDIRRSFEGLYVVPADGSGGPTRIATPNAPQPRSPQWSPDGTQIVFAFEGAGGTTDIGIVPATGPGGITNLTNSAGRSESSPAWSPDGSRLALASVTPPSDDYQLSTMAPQAGAAESFIGEGREPAWSHDGSRIFFNRGFQIFSAEASGGDTLQLTNSRLDASNPASGTGTPTISAVGATVNEGDSGTTELKIPVRLSLPSDQEVTVHYRTVSEGSAGTATAGVDFISVTDAILRFAPGETKATASVMVLGDDVDEGRDAEIFTVEFFQPSNAVLPFAKPWAQIIDDDRPPNATTRTVSIGDATVTEGDSGQTTIEFPVTISKRPPKDENVDIRYTTNDGSATSPADYVDVAGGTVRFKFNTSETTRNAVVTVQGDTLAEGNETFTVTLNAGAWGFPPVLIADGDATGTIIDDDEGPTPTPTTATPPERIAFSSNRSAGATQIFTMRPDGTDVRHVTPDQSSSELGDPSLAPDGKRVIYTALNGAQPEIVDRPSDGSGSFRLLILHSSEDIQPVYRPNDSSQAFVWVSNRDGDREIYYSTPSGAVKQLTDNDAEDASPTFSPAGERLVFHSDSDGDLDLYSMELSAAGDPGTVTNLTPSRASEDRNPDFAAGANKIAFVSDEHGDPDIFTMDLTSGAVTHLTTSGLADEMPSLSLDGSQVAFVRANEIYKMATQHNAAETNITNNAARDLDPDWGRALVPSTSRVPALEDEPASQALLPLGLLIGSVWTAGAYLRRRKGETRSQD